MESNPVWIFLQEFLQNHPVKGGAKPQSQAAGDGKGPKKGGEKPQSSSELTGKEKGMKILLGSWTLGVNTTGPGHIPISDVTVFSK